MIPNVALVFMAPIHQQEKSLQENVQLRKPVLLGRRRELNKKGEEKIDMP